MVIHKFRWLTPDPASVLDGHEAKTHRRFNYSFQENIQISSLTYLLTQVGVSHRYGCLWTANLLRYSGTQQY